MFAFLGLILAVVVLDAVQGTDLSHIKMLTMDVSSEDQDIVVGLSAQQWGCVCAQSPRRRAGNSHRPHKRVKGVWERGARKRMRRMRTQGTHGDMRIGDVVAANLRICYSLIAFPISLHGLAR